MHSFNVAEVRSLLRGDRAVPAPAMPAAAIPASIVIPVLPAPPPILALTAAISTHRPGWAPQRRLLVSFGMTVCLLAGLIYETGLPYLSRYLARSGAPAGTYSASAPLPAAPPATAAAPVAEAAPPAIAAADIHLVPAFRPGLDFGPVLSRLNISALPAHSAEGGPYLTIAAMHSGAAAAQHHPAALPPAPRRAALAAPLGLYHLESRFGRRRDPFNGEMAFHAGVDLVAPFRSPVYGAAPGIVVFAGVKGAYGNCIDIDHGNGLVTRYGHLDRILVVRGQHVGAHQKIALLGDTGRSTGPHLHFEVRVNDAPQDPLKFLYARRGPAVIPVAAASTDSD